MESLGCDQAPGESTTLASGVLSSWRQVLSFRSPCPFLSAHLCSYTFCQGSRAAGSLHKQPVLDLQEAKLNLISFQHQGRCLRSWGLKEKSLLCPMVAEASVPGLLFGDCGEGEVMVGVHQSGTGHLKRTGRREGQEAQGPKVPYVPFKGMFPAA